MDEVRPVDSFLYRYDRAAVDPITFEVIHHRLISISEEQAATLSAISGSPLVNDATDFNTGIFRAHGEIVTLGKTVLYHAASVAEMVKHIMADCAVSPGIRPGDMFLVNHPYKGALHPPDFGLAAPAFHDGKLIGWVGVCSHQIDVGSVFGTEATEAYQEGILVPPLRVVEDDQFRSDMLAMILGMSRLPVNMALDFRGMLAANRVALRRLKETIDQYGVDTVLSVMDGAIEISEKAVRERLKELPDGIYRAQALLDHDGVQNKLYRIHVEMTKTGDHLKLDFTKSADQAPRFMNCTASGLLAGIRAGMLPILAYDLPWNEGVFRPMEVIARPGSIVSATFPAPVGQGPIGAMWLVESVVIEVLSKLVATSPKYIREAQSAPNGGPDTFNLQGLNQYGEPNHGASLDQVYVGGGAYCHRDGLSPQGHRHIPAIRLQNIERAENNTPLLYLFRKFLRDTAGPGRNRGGVSVGHGYILHDVEKMNVRFSCHCYESPTSLGLFGGYPSACNTRRLRKNATLRASLDAGRIPADLESIGGELQHYPAKMTRPDLFTRNDVFENGPSAGAGWGDPIEREPERVVQDIRFDMVSRGAARLIYGVVVAADGTLDAKATAARRAEILAERLGWTAERSLADAPPKDAKGEILALAGDRASIQRIGARAFFRCACGTCIAPANENWKYYALQSTATAAELGPRITLHEELEARRYACPGCGRLHNVEVKLKSDPPLYDSEIKV
ncbi:MAG TPA: hydantoinase B/oxoprolinase family protein [Stellaceae bacterium]|nr:hydantoinase B/oxoprolinase family protein [Stellaceae bacterium]